MSRPCTSVVPREDASLKRSDGAHFASFLRGGSREQTHELLRAVGAAVDARMSEVDDGARPLWVSTSGSGVSWLHVRLDERPKYYTFQPYARWPTATERRRWS